MLHEHLFPGDGKEAVALALCGAAHGEVDGRERTVLTVHETELIPHRECSRREADLVTWPTDRAVPLLERALERGLKLLKLHSHPNGYPGFSSYDDTADLELFTGVGAWLDDTWPGISAVMLEDGRIFARAVADDGGFAPVPRVAVAGEAVLYFDRAERSGEVPAFAERTAQAFGAGTTQLLGRLSIGVVGTSGTGSPVVEMLARLGVGELVLVDPDRVEYRNLNRIYNASAADAALRRPKVHVLAGAVASMGLGTRVTVLPEDLFSPVVVRRLAQCDLLIGCLDSVDGRDLLNRLAASYLIPFIDIGVRLEADGAGGIDQVCGSVHYLQPDGSSLLSRGVYTPAQVQAAALRRTDPAEYERRRREKYIKGVEEDRPAVISVNTFFAAMAVNELLARLHPYRDDPNGDYSSVTTSLSQMRLICSEDGDPCPSLARLAGRGDQMPLLGVPELSS